MKKPERLPADSETQPRLPIPDHRKDARTLGDTITTLGYTMSECRSSLQKCVRRGDERGAAWWAEQILRHGWWAYFWRCLQMFASEDVGVADPEVAVQVAALASNAKKITENWKKLHHAGLIEMHGLLLLCRVKKCWTATHCLLETRRLFRQVQSGTIERPAVPAFAYDHHVRRDVPKIGWLEEGNQLAPQGETHPSAGR
jgi:replication-associated recombination protein RarA